MQGELTCLCRSYKECRREEGTSAHVSENIKVKSSDFSGAETMPVLSNFNPKIPAPNDVLRR